MPRKPQCPDCAVLLNCLHRNRLSLPTGFYFEKKKKNPNCFMVFFVIVFACLLYKSEPMESRKSRGQKLGDLGFVADSSRPLCDLDNLLWALCLFC